MTREENFDFRVKIIKSDFENRLGYKLNLEDPKTFNEKMQWLKLYYYDPFISIAADKYAVRDHIKNTIGEEYLIPLLNTWDKPEDIEFDKLPNQFVLKVNWGSGQNIIVRDKEKLDIEAAKRQLSEWMKPHRNHYYYSFEMGYKYIKPRIICEEYFGALENNLTVYHLCCTEHEPFMFQVIFDAKTPEESLLYYDASWNKFPFKRSYPEKQGVVEKPKSIDDMLRIAKILAKDFPSFVRVDFFEVDGRTYFSEITFYSHNGVEPFIPQEWDRKLGDLIKLPNKQMEYDVVTKEHIMNNFYDLEYLAKRVQILEDTAPVFDNNTINNLNNTINSLNNEINNYKEEIKSKISNKDLKINWLPTVFGISNNKDTLRIIILFIKITIKMTEKTINKLAWWIPIRKWREDFRAKFL